MDDITKKHLINTLLGAGIGGLGYGVLGSDSSQKGPEKRRRFLKHLLEGGALGGLAGGALSYDVAKGPNSSVLSNLNTVLEPFGASASADTVRRALGFNGREHIPTTPKAEASQLPAASTNKNLIPNKNTMDSAQIKPMTDPYYATLVEALGTESNSSPIPREGLPYWVAGHPFAAAAGGALGYRSQSRMNDLIHSTNLTNNRNSKFKPTKIPLFGKTRAAAKGAGLGQLAGILAEYAMNYGAGQPGGSLAQQAYEFRRQQAEKLQQ